MRRISENLIDKLLNGELKLLLDYIRSDEDLRLEIRKNNKACVYYLKGKALEIPGLRVDNKYGNVPCTKLAISNPKLYFKRIKESIDSWLVQNKNRDEFETQQRIAQHNQCKEDKYLILDMEYAFDQSEIKKSERLKRAIFDLIGVERETGQIIFFEIKRGLNSLKGKSGVKSHIEDFESYLSNVNSSMYLKNLETDIENILRIKKRLRVIYDYKLPESFNQNRPELVFIYHKENASDVGIVKKIIGENHKLIIVDEENYKLE